MTKLADAIAKAIEAAPTGEHVVLSIPVTAFLESEIESLRAEVAALREDKRLSVENIAKFGEEDGRAIGRQRAVIAKLTEALDDIRGQLGSCRVQRAPSDDRIIAEHIDSCHVIADVALAAARELEQKR